MNSVESPFNTYSAMKLRPLESEMIVLNTHLVSKAFRPGLRNESSGHQIYKILNTMRKKNRKEERKKNHLVVVVRYTLLLYRLSSKILFPFPIPSSVRTRCLLKTSRFIDAALQILAEMRIYSIISFFRFLNVKQREHTDKKKIVNLLKRGLPKYDFYGHGR